MTVDELIEALKKYPGDTRVLIEGYEDGLNDIDVKCDGVVFDVNDTHTWYIGVHMYAKDTDNKDGGTECVIIVGWKERPTDPTAALA